MYRVLLLIATTSYRAEDFLAAAGRLGVDVVVGSDHKQVLADFAPGSALALDLSATERATRKIVDLAAEYPLDAVVATEDDGAVLAAAASEALGLPHNPLEAVRTAARKDALRRALAEAGVPSPGFRTFSTHEDPARAAAAVDYPCVLKPVFLSASRGVIRADGPDEFAGAFRRIAALLAEPDVARRGGEAAEKILVEDYVPGTEVALEGLLSGGELEVLALLDKPDPLVGPYFEETIYVTPSRLPAAVRREIVHCAQRAVDALGLTEGPIHAELRHSEQGARLIEIAPRSIGGLCSRTLRFGTGRSLEEVILRHAIGEPVRDPARETEAAGVLMLPIPRAGVLREVRGAEAAEAVDGIEDVVVSIPIGREVVPLPEGNRYLGFLFARADSPERVEQALREAHGRLEFDIGEQPEP